MFIYYVLLVLEQFHNYPRLGVPLFKVAFIPITPVKIAGLGALLAALMLARPGNGAARRTSVIGVLFLLFIGGSLLSVVMFGLPAPLGSLPFMISFCLLLPATRRLVCTEERLRNTCRTLVLAAAFSTLWSFKEHLAGASRAWGVSDDPNYNALVLVTMIPLGIWMARQESKRCWRVAGLMAAVAMALAIMLTESRGGIIAFGVVAVGEVMRARRKPGLRLWLIAALGVLVLFAPSGIWHRFQDLRTREVYGAKPQVVDRSAQSHVELAVAGWRMIERHPFVGIGLDRFWAEGPRYNPALKGVHFLAHDTFIQIAAECGVPTFVVFCLIMAVAFANCRAAARVRPGSPLSELAVAVRLSLRGFAMGALFITAWFLVPYWLLVFLSQNVREVADQATAHSEPKDDSRDRRPARIHIAKVTTTTIFPLAEGASISADAGR